MFSYSGTTNDLIYSTNNIDNNIKYMITKGQKSKVKIKTSIPQEHIISYRTKSNKGKEKGFLSFEGACAPAGLFLRLYLEGKEDTDLFVKKSISYWKNYFEDYFKDNKKKLKNYLSKGTCVNVFTGDYTKSAGIDLESKLIESGYLSVLMHEKKNFSHGRFINYEHLSSKINIYFKQKKHLRLRRIIT